MIISDRTVGYSSVRGSPFSSRKGFSSRRPQSSRGEAYPNANTTVTASLIDNTSIYRLKNTKSDFIFRYDYSTGIRLDKFKSLSGDNYFINSSRVLWELCVRRNTLADTPLSTFVDVYYIRPNRETFLAPSLTPHISPEGDESYTFIWDNIKYDYSNPERTCKVTLIATLPIDKDYVEMSLEVYSNQAIGSDFSLCVSAVKMPSLAIRKQGSSSYQESDFLSVPLLEGQTILNPIKRLQAPRFENESIQYNEFGTKTYFGGTPIGYSPVNTVLRGSYGNPGILSIPLLIYGNKESKDGFLYYAYDPDGLHAKNFQFYSDGLALHIKSYDLSDHEVEPFGMGGKDTRYTNVYNISSSNLGSDEIADTEEVIYGNRTNTLGWKIRIRPYQAPTIWADWYGAKLYKSEVVPELESLGIVPKSYYSRYSAGGIASLRDIEIPICAVSFGQLTGTAYQQYSGVQSLQDLYRDSLSSGQDPRALNLYYSPTLNSGPILPSVTGITSYYHGWESWANGTYTGVSVFKSPDYSGINSVYSGAISLSLRSGQYPYLYLLNSFRISTGSVWVQTYSGIDTSTKELYNSSDTITNQNYTFYENNVGSVGALTGFDFAVCHAYPRAYNKYIDILSGLARDGSFIYDDTAGNWGRGCYAEDHHHYDPASSLMKKFSHPKGKFTHFYNSIQKDWLTGARKAKEYINSNWSGPTGSSFSLSHMSEYPCDSNLQDIGSTLLYSPSSVVLQQYFTPLALSNELYTGAPRSDALFGSLATVTWNSASVEAKNWNLLNPIYSTVYGDRSIILDWISPWVSNILDVSGLFGSDKGTTNIYGYPDSVSSSHVGRTVQIKNWMAGHLNHFTRVTAGVASNQYGTLATGASGHIYNTVADNLAASPWTGVRDFTKSIFRLLGYAPDHMYHGTIEHPLESWEGTNNYDAYIARGVRASRLPNSNDWSNGDDTVIHGVRRHRDDNSILIWLANWCSGAQGFTGIFDPSVYEFTKGYNVYTIGLNDSNNGNFTFVDLYQKEETYQIAQTLPENTIAAYLFQPVTKITHEEQFLNLTTDFTYLRYSYGQESLTTSFCNLSYDYGCAVTSEVATPIVGRNASATQEIVNNLPPWMEGRQNTSSTMWKLVNSWGQNIEELVEQTADFVADKYLQTSNLSKRSLINISNINAPELLEDRDFGNLLYNSSFSIPGLARYNMPSGWSTFNKRSQSTYITNHKAFICPTSIEVNTYGKFGQTVYVNNTSIKDLTASIYMLANTTNIEVSLLTIAETIDGILISKQSTFSTRSGEWRRLNHKMEINAKVYRIQFIISAYCDEPIYFNAPMLSVGSSVVKWTRNTNDYLPYVGGGSIFSQIVAIGNSLESNRKINIFPIGDEKEFLQIAIPTRIEPIINNSLKDLNPFTNNVYGRKVSFHKEIYDTQWAIINNMIQLRSYSSTEFDVFREFSIRDLQVNTELTYGSITEDNLSFIPLLLTIRDGYLYILGQETYFGNTNYVIKIVRAVDPYGDKGYLESIADFKIDLPVNINQYFNELSESLTTIAFSELDPSVLVITTNLSRQFYYKLYFDYQYFSSANNRIYMIENYPDSKVSIT